MIGVAVLTLYGLVTTISGIVALRRTGILDIPRIQVVVFILVGVAVIVVSMLSMLSMLSIVDPVGLFWLVVVSLASLLSRVWNGFALGRVHITHIVLFGSVLALGVALTQV